MRVVTFASGSTGNCSLVSEGDTHILIDAGISMRRIKKALEQFSLTMADINGVFITHEHSDHVSGLKTMVKYNKPAIFAPRTVANHLIWAVTGIEEFMNIFPVGESFMVGCLEIKAFHTSHDTDESVGYVVEGGEKLAYCTDTGCVTQEMMDAIAGASIAIIESNHDVAMLQDGEYPYYLKRRVLSDRGHLSNDDCAKLAEFLSRNGAKELILAHLSRDNNTPIIALQTVCDHLDRMEQYPRVQVAPVAEFCVIEGESLC